MTISKALKKLRRAKMLTQSEAAEQLGISLSTYQKYERDKNSIIPSLEMLLRIADFYGVSTDFLLGRPVNEPVLDDETRKLVYAMQDLPAEKKKTVVDLLLLLLTQP